MYLNDSSFIIGIDVGKTKIASGIISSKGEIILFAEEPTDISESGKKIINQIISIIDKMMGKGYSIYAIGVGTFGLIDYKQDIVIGSRILKNYANIPLRKILQAKYNIPVKIENDIVSATIGEYLFGLNQKQETIAFLSIGTATGLGLILNNKVYRGSHGLAGQIAHIINHNADSETLNDSMSGGGVSNNASNMFGTNLTTADILKRADCGDEKAGFIKEKMLNQIGFIIALIQVIIDPEIVILGGGVVNNQEKIINQIETKTLESLGFYSTKLPKILNLKKSFLGTKAGILGVASLISE
ncbi:MAG: ROK family protein [Minisyncoccia bacterium]